MCASCFMTCLVTWENWKVEAFIKIRSQLPHILNSMILEALTLKQ